MKEEILITATFLLGFISCLALIGLYNNFNIEIPLATTGFSIFSKQAFAPSNSIAEKDIEVYEDKIVIYVENPSISNYAPTGSMRPVIDVYANGIRVVPVSEDEIKIGDIVSFEKDNRLIVHRIVEKGLDEEGFYFITKGDNNPTTDKGKLRFKDIKYKTIGVIW
jgi:signal peptidase I